MKVNIVKVFYAVLISTQIFSSCVTTESIPREGGKLNLHTNFLMRTYTNLEDTSCGCPSGNTELWAYDEPRLTITNDSGKVQYYVSARDVKIINLPLAQGIYTVRYEFPLKKLTACDSVRDIWKVQMFPGSTVFCVRKKNYNYKSIDSTDQFTLKNNETIEIERNF